MDMFCGKGLKAFSKRERLRGKSLNSDTLYSLIESQSVRDQLAQAVRVSCH